MAAFTAAACRGVPTPVNRRRMSPGLKLYSLMPPGGLIGAGQLSAVLSSDGGDETFHSQPVLAEGPGRLLISQCTLRRGEVELDIKGPQGQFAVLESSVDLVQWKSEETIYLETGEQLVRGIEDGAAEMRFFRLRIPEAAPMRRIGGGLGLYQNDAGR